MSELKLSELKLTFSLFSIRKLKAPRKREIEALPRSFNYAYWAPNHLLVFAVTAIFAILNPLVIAFNAFYQALVIIVYVT